LPEHVKAELLAMAKAVAAVLAVAAAEGPGQGAQGEGCNGAFVGASEKTVDLLG
jgi:hypothetical protein